MTNTCETCGVQFTPKPGHRAGRFCSISCYHTSGQPRNRQETTTKPRQRTAHGHPLAPPSGIVGEARLVLYDKIGGGTHACHWCSDPVTWMPGKGLANGALIADHLDWDIHNNDPANLVPSCNVCNVHRTRKQNRLRIQDEELFIQNGPTRTRAIRVYCGMCGSEFLAIPSQVRAGKSRYCSRSCARKAPRRSAWASR